MKENSIEEDIKILEEMIENANIENMDMNDCFGGEHIDAIEHVLSDYKRVLEMNEVLLKENEELKLKERRIIIGKYGEVEIHDVINRTLSNDYISIKKVKDKISERQFELQQEYKDFEDDAILTVLQELIEGR